MKKKYITVGIIALVFAVGLSLFGVKAADNRNINDLIELAKVVNESNSEVISAVIGMFGGDGMLGGGTRFPNGISADNTSPSSGEVRGTTLTTTGAVSIGGEAIFAGNVITGGATTTITATTSAGDLLLTAAQICDGGENIYLAAGIDAGAFTVTLPTAALLSADCLGTIGSKTIWIDNNSGDNATITTGTGGDLLEGDSLNVVIATAHQASIDIQMLNGGASYRASVVEWQDAD